MVGHWPILRVLSGLGKTILGREDRLFKQRSRAYVSKIRTKGQIPQTGEAIIGKTNHTS